MQKYNPVDDADVPNPTDPEEVMEALEPEVKEGPFGVPYPKPSGGPDLPGTR